MLILYALQLLNSLYFTIIMQYNYLRLSNYEIFCRKHCPALINVKVVIKIESDTSFEKNSIFNIPAPIFECDTNYNIVSINDYTKKNFADIRIGDNMRNFSSANVDILRLALISLKNGKPYYSSDFILTLKKIPIHFYPILNQASVLSRIICSLITDDNVRPHNDADCSASVQLPYAIGSLLRTPTMNILGNLQSIAVKLEDSEQYAELDRLNDIAKNCYYMLKSSKNLTTYYKLVNNEIHFDYSIIEINTPFKNIMTTVQAMVIDTGYELDLDISDEPLIVRCDFEYITYAFFQVVLNSLMFSPPESRIKISLSQNNSSACIMVSDEGIGIEGELIERVFEPFFSNKSGIPSSSGYDLGLGLPITKRIIESHGGSIYITSEVNKGTSIVLRLPLVEDMHDVNFHLSSTKYLTRSVSDIYVYFNEILNLKLY